MENEYINTAKARSLLGITASTLREWDKKNKIRTIRTPSNTRMYNKQDIFNIIGRNCDSQEKQKIIYARVSSKKQMDDLNRQADFLKSKYPNHILVTDIASGINWKRKGLNSILERAMSGELEEIVVAHKDRLCRFAFGLLEFIFKTTNTRLVVLDSEEGKPTEQELADDILSIVHVFSCRSMGKRRYTNKENTNIPHQGAEGDIQELDGDNEICIQ